MAAHRRAFGVRPVLRWAVRYANNFFIFLEGLGNFPTSKIPAKLYMSGRDFTEVGTRFLCLLFKFLVLLHFDTVVDVFPASIG